MHVTDYDLEVAGRTAQAVADALRAARNFEHHDTTAQRMTLVGAAMVLTAVLEKKLAGFGDALAAAEAATAAPSA